MEVNKVDLFLFFKEQTTHRWHVSSEINSSANVYIILMWISSLGSVLWHRLVETGNDDPPTVAVSSLEELGLILDIAMLFVAAHGLKLYTTLHCKI